MTEHATRHRWKDLPKDHPIEGLERARVTGTQAMVARVRLSKGCVIPAHAHENEQFVCLLSGKMRFTIGEAGGDEITVEGGDLLHLPPWVRHGATVLEESVVLDVFSPPSERTGIDRA